MPKKTNHTMYTQQEITQMADNCFKRCCNYYLCDHYESVSMPFHNNEQLFAYCATGCYYACGLPWEKNRWCVFDSCKNAAQAEILDSLTWKNVKPSK